MPFRVPDGGIETRSLDLGSEILTRSFPGAFLAFFGWLRVPFAYRLESLKRWHWI
jgi:hypothetical protein